MMFMYVYGIDRGVDCVSGEYIVNVWFQRRPDNSDGGKYKYREMVL